MNYYNDLGTNQAAVYTFGPADVVQTVTNFIGSRIFGMEILSNTKNSRPDKISDFLIIEWDIGGVNMRNHGQYLIMINRDHTNVEVV